MSYTKTVWQDLPSTATPINATNLNNIENGIENAFKKIEGQPIAENTDLNDITEVGAYYCTQNATVGTLSNCPTTNAFYMEVHEHAGTYQHIITYQSTNYEEWSRNYYYDTGWGAWRKHVIEGLPLSGGTVTGSTTFNAALITRGSVEIYNTTPFIDFHYNNNSTPDYTSRIVETSTGKMQVIANNGFELTCTPSNFKINNQSLESFCVKNGSSGNLVTLSWATTQLKLTVDNTDIGYFAMAGSSDERLKEDIQPIDVNLINAIGEVKLKQFRLKRNNPNKQISFGVIAQELIAAFKKYHLNIEDYSLINTITYEDGIEYYIVDYNQFNTLRLAYLEKKYSQL